MEVISFDISGKIAHFRKYYTNNTALSFSIPPRTTVMGMLAAICGLPKDSYYELFSSRNIDIGIALHTRTKKTIHRLNLLSIKGPNDFRGGKGRIQTPFEIVTGEDIKKSAITYRIFLRPLKIPDKDYMRLKDLLQTKGNNFALTLGAASFNASLSNYQEYEAVERNALPYFEYFDSAINSEDVEEIELLSDGIGRFSIVEEELMPADFVANYNRELRKMNRMLFSVSASQLKARLKESATVIELMKEGKRKLIQFMK
ncbi:MULTISPECIES: CRISPR-associated protein Cas5 [unclassified Proteiniphilum]|jgi:CRISPR-associated protein Cas5h|uniref:CRISPR-associated protein Cas5 n=1 Tax=unclassified Proteiniphilum TaxID=2622718 RepID=UPI00257FE09A|nr:MULTISPECIES: CRISPR-associated protein Cas5 [unclassified Proteiniphilum]